MTSYQVIFYEQEDGGAPGEAFINSLDCKMSAKVYRLLGMIEENGPELRGPYSCHLDDGIFELRAKFGSNITRVLYFFYVGKKIVITNGFVKKSQKTSPTEIEKAKKYRADYLKQEEEKKK
jgi:phage-related protein